MSEDAPLEPIPPATEPVTAEVVTAETPTAEPPTDAVPAGESPTGAGPTGTPPGPPPWAAGPGYAAAPPPQTSSTVAVPKWLLLVVGAVVIAGLGFAIGYVAAPGDDDSSASAPSTLPSPFGGNGNGGNGGNVPTNPTVPPLRLRAAFLGVATQASTDPRGTRIVRVVPGSPAGKADLESDDVITKVDDETVSTPEELASLIGDHRAGDEVTITYVRGSKTDTARVTLVRRSSLQIPTPSTTAPRL